MTESIDGDGDGGSLMEVVVRAGRTVTLANPWKHVKQLVQTPQGPAEQYVKVALPEGEVSFGPGETVHLPHDEAARLEALGFVGKPGDDQNTRPLPPHRPRVAQEGDDQIGLIDSRVR